MAMEIKVIDNRDLMLSDYLSQHLTLASGARIATAYIKISGLRKVEGRLTGILTSGGKVEVICGLDFRITDPLALRRLMELSQAHNLSVYAFSDTVLSDVPSFHPKLYILDQIGNQTVVIIGSSNLTSGGLADNVELNLGLTLDSAHDLTQRIVQVYQRIRMQESLFAPDEEYIESYAKMFHTIRRRGSTVLRTPNVRDALKELKERESQLPGTAPTQKGLIIEAIKRIRSTPGDFVHLRDISSYVEKRARDIGLPYKWNTLWNSIRGRLNEHTVGKDGENLFVRKGGVSGREGLYQLSEKGENYTGR